MSAPTKTMKQEELREVIGQNAPKIRDANVTLGELLEQFRRAGDFTFSELDTTKKALAHLDDLTTALKTIKAAMIVRARTKVSEVSK